MNRDIAVAIVRRLALLGAVLAGPGCVTNPYYGDCSHPPKMEIDVSVAALAQRVDADAGEIDAEVARCEAAANDCAPLCQRALAPNSGLAYDSCQLVPTDAGGLLVHIVYTAPCGL
jgi:hypothetical protein